jgi:hypothetical protein
MGIPNHIENSIWAASSKTRAQINGVLINNNASLRDLAAAPRGYQMSHMPAFVRLLIKTWPAFIIVSHLMNFQFRNTTAQQQQQQHIYRMD